MSEDSKKKDDTCRDFLRGICNRGNRCKYTHPEGVGSSSASSLKDIEFCHDYQNPGGCSRLNCKFFHATKAEEARYFETGDLPPSRGSRGHMGGAGLMMRANLPVCKDFMYSRCDRGGRCRYRHITQSEYEFEQSMISMSQAAGGGSGFNGFGGFGSGGMGGMQGGGGFGSMIGGKRMRLMDGFGGFGGGGGGGDVESMVTPCEECPRLKERIRDLEKQVTYLTAANEVLLEQNARIRVSSSSTTNVLQSTGGGGNMSSVAGQAGTGTMTSIPSLVSYPASSQVVSQQ